MNAHVSAHAASRELASTVDQAAQRIFQGVQAGNLRLSAAQHEEAIELAIRAYTHRTVIAMGTDPVVAAVNETPEPHQRAAMSLVRALARHDDAANSSFDAASVNPFSNRHPKLAEIYNSEQRYITYLGERGRRGATNQQEPAMPKLSEALDDTEYELVVEAMTRLRETKVQAWRQSQEDPSTQSFTRADFGIDRIDALLKKLDVGITEDRVPDALPPPRIGIKMEGGVIQNVFADRDASVYVINYDKDDIEDARAPEGYEDEDEGVCQLDQDGGRMAECLLRRYGAELAPSWFPRMDKALEEHAEAMEQRLSQGRPKP